MSRQQEIVVLDFWPSAFGMRVRLALAEKGLEYELREEDLSQKSPLLLHMNPVHKKIPVFIHNGKPIAESLIIVEYIDEVWEASPLMPKDPYDRARARFWADFIDKKIYNCGTRIWKCEGEESRAAIKELIEILKLLEGALGDEPYFGGETFAFLDVALIPFSCWLKAYEVTAGFKIQDDCPKFMEWVDRCMKRESVSKIVPETEKICDFIAYLKKKSGV